MKSFWQTTTRFLAIIEASADSLGLVAYGSAPSLQNGNETWKTIYLTGDIHPQQVLRNGQAEDKPAALLQGDCQIRAGFMHNPEPSVWSGSSQGLCGTSAPCPQVTLFPHFSRFQGKPARVLGNNRGNSPFCPRWHSSSRPRANDKVWTGRTQQDEGKSATPLYQIRASASLTITAAPRASFGLAHLAYFSCATHKRLHLWGSAKDSITRRPPLPIRYALWTAFLDRFLVCLWDGWELCIGEWRAKWSVLPRAHLSFCAPNSFTGYESAV